MGKSIPTLDEVVQQLRCETEQCIQQVIESHQRRLSENIKRVETNYQVAADLDAAAIGFKSSDWERMKTLRVDLGKLPNPRRTPGKFREWRDKLRTLKHLLGEFTTYSTDIVNAKARLVEVTLQPKSFPGVFITYQRTLSTTDKCHIKYHRPSGYSTLVCDR